MGDAQAQLERDSAIRETIHQKLRDTGEKERLKDLLRQRLIECGWYASPLARAVHTAIALLCCCSSCWRS